MVTVSLSAQCSLSSSNFFPAAAAADAPAPAMSACSSCAESNSGMGSFQRCLCRCRAPNWPLGIMPETALYSATLFMIASSSVLLRYVPMTREEAYDRLLSGTSEVACVLDGLPVDVRTGIVSLQLDDNEPAICIDRQQIQSLTRPVEAAELLRDYQKVVAEDIGIGRHPLLNISPLPQAQLGEVDLLQRCGFACRRIDSEQLWFPAHFFLISFVHASGREALEHGFRVSANARCHTLHPSG